MKLQLTELQKSDNETWKIKAEGLNKYDELDGILYHQGLPFIPEIIWIKLISSQHDNSITRYFRINKTKEFISRKYY